MAADIGDGAAARRQGGATALLVVTSRPAAPLEPAYHEWYEEEHIPARTRLPGWLTARRYLAPDDGSFLAYYDLANLGLLSDPEYVRLRANRSAREQAVLGSVEFLDRRVYRRLEQHAGADTGQRADELKVCGALLLCVWWEPSPGTEHRFHTWYEEEHLPLLAAVPGWLRTRRFELAEGEGPRFLAMHDLADESVFSHPAYRAATSTPRRDAVVADRVDHQRRVYRLLRNLDPESAVSDPDRLP